MRPFFPLFGGFLTYYVLSAAAIQRECGMSEPTREQVLVDRTKIEEAQRRAPDDFRIPPIKVYAHIIRDSRGGGDISNQQIQCQIDVLNEDYALSSVNFQLQDITRTNNDAWARLRQNSAAEKEMKKALRKGDQSTLNMYFTDTGVVLGWATFPNNYEDNPTIDGVVIQKGTLPGGPLEPFNLGRTGTHEVGHWLGLYHTFQGGCSKSNDFVVDTPAMPSASFGCQIGRPACDSKGKSLDPVKNFMDYSDDACMSFFTVGQGKRMNAYWMTFRT